MATLKRLYWHIIRLTGLCGTGTKPPGPDCHHCTVPACHDEIDRRTHFVDAAYAKNARWKVWRETQVIWLKEGLVKA